MERLVFEQEGSEEAPRQYPVFSYFQGYVVEVVLSVLVEPPRLQIQGQLFLNILSNVLISEEKGKKDKVILRIAYQP